MELIGKYHELCGNDGSTEQRIKDCNLSEKNWKLVAAEGIPKFHADNVALAVGIRFQWLANIHIYAGPSPFLVAMLGEHENDFDAATKKCDSIVNSGGRIGKWRIPSPDETLQILKIGAGDRVLPGDLFTEYGPECFWTSNKEKVACSDG